MIYELIPIHSNFKSFYGNAKVQLSKTDNTEVYTLFSYDTKVATCVKDTETNNMTCTLVDIFSSTTTRHQKEFFQQMGMSEKDVDDLFKEYRNLKKRGL